MKNFNILLSFNTVNGKYCCNLVVMAKQWLLLDQSFNTVNGKYCCNLMSPDEIKITNVSFNTVNGKYCCNGVDAAILADKRVA